MTPKKNDTEITKINWGFKGENQLPLFMLWREYWEDDELIYAEVLFNTSIAREKVAMALAYIAIGLAFIIAIPILLIGCILAAIFCPDVLRNYEEDL